MQFSTIFVAAISLALAQAKISFTTLPNAVEAGKPVTLKWTGGTDSPVTITLKRGDSNDLKTVQVLTGNGQGDSFTWTPSSNLENGDDYALQISQGVDEVNYTGQFSVSGGSDEGDSSSSSSGYPTSSVASASASTTIETTVTSVNSTSSRSHTVYVTGTAPASASGTGITISRNTTFSSATPTRSSSSGDVSTTGAATTTSDSGASETTSAASEPSSGAASRMDIQIGAGIAAIVALAAMF